MTGTPVKKNLSSIHVLKTLYQLLQGDFTMPELIARLNAGEKERAFNNSVISKYINTCRFCGIDIGRVNNRYFIRSMPFGIELSAEDISLLENLRYFVRNEMAKKYNKIFDNFISKINKFSGLKVRSFEKGKYDISSELFENALKDRRKIRLTLKNGTEMECIPLNVEESFGKTFFQVLYKNKEHYIEQHTITGFEITDSRYIPGFSGQVVIYELKGALAQRYRLRENERLVKTYDGKSITVSNHGESRDILLSRLLRYDDKCEIISPGSYREEMTEIIDSALKNYGEL